MSACFMKCRKKLVAIFLLFFHLLEMLEIDRVSSFNRNKYFYDVEVILSSTPGSEKDLGLSFTGEFCCYFILIC